MKIIKLTAENIKKLSVVEIAPDGNVVQITGKNGQGKTSVLDALWWAFTGTDNIQAKPIRQGEDSARVELQLGSGDKVELIVERRFTEANSYLTVKTADGAKYPKPQSMLDDVIGALSLDPLAFMRAKAKDQFDMLRGLVTLDIDPEALDAANKADFDERTSVNREAKAKHLQAEGIVVPEGLPAEPVDEQDLLDQFESAAETNADIERRRSNRANAEAGIKEKRATAADLRARASEMLEKASDLESAATETEAKIKEAGPLPELVDVSALRAEIEAAKAINAGIATRARREQAMAEVAALKEKSDALTAAIEKRNQEKIDGIARAEMPVAGLSLGDGVVTFNSVPLDQASDAEQLTVSMSIAAAMNPKLRVLRIRDGSLLDDDAMKRLAAFADERDMQVWIERVDGSGTVGFVMEDGHIRGQAPAAQVEKPAKGTAKGKAA